MQMGAVDRIQRWADQVVAEQNIPGVMLGATNAEGELFYIQAGDKVFGQPDQGKIHAGTTTEMFSQTKFVASIAALQLVDRGLLDLDEDVGKHLPELAAVAKRGVFQGIDEDGKERYLPAERAITLRMLLSHTSGCAYPQMHAHLREWIQTHPGIYDLYSSEATVQSLCTPLLYQPGTSFAYSNGLDWVGILIERISHQSLEEYFQKHIFGPCGITSMTFYPTDRILAEKMSVCHRVDGKIRLTDDGWGCKRPHEAQQVRFLSAGGGLYGTQRDWLTLLRHILRCHPEYSNAAPLLSPSSYSLLFSPSLNRKQASAAYRLIADPDFLQPTVTAETVNHSLGMFVVLQDCDGARRKGSGGWHGMAQTQFWIDPISRIAGVCATQLLVTPPDPWFMVYRDFERRVYDELA